MKINYYEEIGFKSNNTNILERIEFNRLFSLDMNEINFMVYTIMKNNNEFIIENEDRIRLFQHFIRTAPRVVYDIYFSSINAYINDKSNKEEEVKKYNSIIIPLIIIAIKNNYEENIKMKKIKDNLKTKKI
ncbi:MAG: hypothetical protein LCH34_14275 [Firmicutes bacterium]|nr:hypothetical protein [Bacillota bacterium]